MNPRHRRCGFAGWLLAGLVSWCVSGTALACNEHRQSPGGDLPTVTLVPGVVGDPEGIAVACLQRYGYTPQPGGEEASRLPKGVVVRTSPEEGTTPIQSGAEIFQPIPVTYWVSNGEREVPNVVGDDLTVARIKLALKQFAVGEVTRQEHDGAPDIVLEQTPEAGSTAPPQSSVNLLVSEENPRVPDVVGQLDTQATTLLGNAGFAGSQQGTQDGPQRAGIVVRTDPAANTRAKRGSSVGYWVTSGRNTVPEVRRLSRDDAARKLASEGFALGQVQEKVDLGNPGIVIEQQPVAGTIADVGSGVAVAISKPLVVPTLVGKSEEQANAELQALDLRGVRDGEDNSPKPRGEVLVIVPAAGTRVMNGTAVRYRITSGKNLVPGVLEETAEGARGILEREGFALGDVATRRAAGTQDHIAAQQPAEGATLAVGGRVDIVIRSPLPVVPNVVDKSERDAQQLLRENAFQPRNAGEEPSLKQRGTVLRTDPPAGEKRDENASVDYWIASGQYKVPELAGVSKQDARVAAELDGFRLGEATYEYSTTSADKVIRQSPAARTLAELGTPIAIVVGSLTPPVPDVVGKTADEANALIAAARMTVAPDVHTRYALTRNGRVTAQQPAAGYVDPAGQPIQVTLTINSTLAPLVAGSSILMALLAGAWWTQVRPWPMHWPPTVGMRTTMHEAGAPWPEMTPLHYDPNHDVRLRVVVTPGETTLPDPLPILGTETRHG